MNQVEWNILGKKLVNEDINENENNQLINNEDIKDVETFFDTLNDFFPEKSYKNIDKDKLWEKIDSNLQADYQHVTKTKQLFVFYKVAASVIFIVALSALLLNKTKFFNKTQLTIISTNANNYLQDTLPDGSIVTLSENSKMIISNDFSKQSRTIMFNGEGYFDINRDTLSPFVIKVNSLDIKVLGTAFNIKEDTVNSIVNVVVTNGLVKVEDTKGKTSIILKQGEKAIFSKSNNSLQKIINDDINYLAWRKHNLVFRQTPVDEVTSTLSDIYAIKIEVKKSENKFLTAKFDNQNIESVLEVISLTLNARVTKNQDGYIVEL